MFLTAEISPMFPMCLKIDDVYFLWFLVCEVGGSTVIDDPNGPVTVNTENPEDVFGPNGITASPTSPVLVNLVIT